MGAESDLSGEAEETPCGYPGQPVPTVWVEDGFSSFPPLPWRLGEARSHGFWRHHPCRLGPTP